MAKPTLHSYFGGKTKFESFISPYVPKDFKTYIEPFAGSFAVYFILDIPENCNIIYNDINRDQVNLFTCAKDYNHLHELLTYHLNDPNGLLYCKDIEFESKKEFYKKKYYDLKNSNFRNDTFNIPDYERAVIYTFLLTSAFSSCSYTAAGFSGFNKEKLKILSFIKKLENKQIQEKLSKINSFESINFIDFIKKHDSEDTFIYLDPPYQHDSDKRSGWYGTKNEFGKEQHIELLNLLKNLKSRWALSYYYFKELEELLPQNEYRWKSKDFFRSSASFSENKSTKGTELLIMNYGEKIEKAMDDSSDLLKVSGLDVLDSIQIQPVKIEKAEEDDDFWS